MTLEGKEMLFTRITWGELGTGRNHWIPLKITILVASFPLKADDNIVTNNDRNRKLHNIKKEQSMI